MLEKVAQITVVFVEIFKKVGTLFLLVLMPLYLYFIYIKLSDSDLFAYGSVLAMILALYLPLQVIASQKDLQISFHTIYQDDDILKVIANSALFVIAFAISFFDKQIGKTIFYISWLILQVQLFSIYKMSNIVNKLKLFIVFVPFIFVMSLFVFSAFASFSFTFSINSFFDLFYLLIHLCKMLFLLFPWLILIVANIILALLFKRDASEGSSMNFTFEGVYFILLALMVGYFILLTLTNSIVESINAQEMAFYTVYGFVVLSSFGAYFQLKIFWSYFFNEALSWLLTVVSLVIFIGALAVAINVNDLIEKRSLLISEAQSSFGVFYDKHQ